MEKGMGRRKPTMFVDNLLERLNLDPRLGAGRIQKELDQILGIEARYTGDVKHIAEKYGLHYLKSKRMRTWELKQWIKNNHPALIEARRLGLE